MVPMTITASGMQRPPHTASDRLDTGKYPWNVQEIPMDVTGEIPWRMEVVVYHLICNITWNMYNMPLECAGNTTHAKTLSPDP